MDGRLYKLSDKRLGHLLKTDLPRLAMALAAQQRGQCHVWRTFVREIACYHLFWEGQFDLWVRGDDWAKIQPYVLRGDWNIRLVPTQEVGYLHPERALAVPLPESDPLYLRILADLEREFPDDYPTSPL